MNFLEHYLGVSPDGGNGIVEISYLFTIGIASIVLIFRRLIALALRRSFLTRLRKRA